MCTFDQLHQTIGKKYNTHDSIIHMLKTLKWPSLQKRRENPHLILIAVESCKNFSLYQVATYMPLLSRLLLE